MLPVTLPFLLTVALPPSLSSAEATHKYCPASEVLSVPKDTLTVEDDSANRLVNVILFLVMLAESSTVTVSLVTLTLTVTIQLSEKSTDPSTSLPEVEKLTETTVEGAHTCGYHQLTVNSALT